MHSNTGLFTYRWGRLNVTNTGEWRGYLLPLFTPAFISETISVYHLDEITDIWSQHHTVERRYRLSSFVVQVKWNERQFITGIKCVQFYITIVSKIVFSFSDNSFQCCRQSAKMILQNYFWLFYNQKPSKILTRTHLYMNYTTGVNFSFNGSLPKTPYVLDSHFNVLKS